MKRKIITISIIIVIIIFVVLGVKMFDSSTQEIIDYTQDTEMIQYSDKETIQSVQEEEKKTIKGKGVIVSFNTEKFETGYWTSIDEECVKDGELVEANQKILKVSNADANGVIYSTIAGKFFINETKEKKDYYIYDLNNMGFEMEVEEKEAFKLKIGQFVDISINSLSDKIIGKVYYISSISNNGIVKVKIKIDYDERIKFGYTAKAEILLDKEIDPEVAEFDTKNSFIKIGKTAITYKNMPNDIPIIEDPSMFEFPEFSEDGMDEPQDFPMDEPENENPDELEYDIEDISEYYNGYWSEYWNEYWEDYWRSYYENGDD